MPDPPQLAAAARPSSCSWRPGRARGSPGVAAADTPEIRLLPWLLRCAHTSGMERRGAHLLRERPRLESRACAWCATPSIIFAGKLDTYGSHRGARRRGRRTPAARRLQAWKCIAC